MKEKQIIVSWNKIQPSTAAKDRMRTNILRQCESQSSEREDGPMREKMFRKKYVYALACVTVVLMTGISAFAFSGGSNVLRGVFSTSPEGEFERNVLNIYQVSESNGWTLALTDCVADQYNLYFGMELIAPEGTVLDESYCFDSWDIIYKGVRQDDYPSGSHIEYLPDDDKTDNVKPFALYINTCGRDTQGLTANLKFGKIYQNVWNLDSEWNPERQLIDVKGFTFKNVKLDYPDNSLSFEPKQRVDYLDGQAEVKNITVSPLSVTVNLEGGSIYDHHRRDTGGKDCLRIPIKVFDRDGNLMKLSQHGGGAGCDQDKGTMYVNKIFTQLIDPETVGTINVCGVKIKLNK